MKKYRFKTEQELINDYGEDWWDYIKYRWDDKGLMDYLFGKEISRESYEKINSEYTHKIPEACDWCISKEMLTVDETIKENNMIEIVLSKKNKITYRMLKERSACKELLLWFKDRFCSVDDRNRISINKLLDNEYVQHRGWDNWLAKNFDIKINDNTLELNMIDSDSDNKNNFFVSVGDTISIRNRNVSCVDILRIFKTYWVEKSSTTSIYDSLASTLHNGNKVYMFNNLLDAMEFAIKKAKENNK